MKSSHGCPLTRNEKIRSWFSGGTPTKVFGMEAVLHSHFPEVKRSAAQRRIGSPRDWPPRWRSVGVYPLCTRVRTVDLENVPVGIEAQ
jgi:hypothetical protein